MKDTDNYDSLFEMYIFETTELLGQMEQLVMKDEAFGFVNVINEIFRIMHTIKGTSAMMNFDQIARLSHAMEDLFYYIRENQPTNLIDSFSDVIFGCIDFVKVEVHKISEGEENLSDATEKIDEINKLLNQIKAQHTPKKIEQMNEKNDQVVAYEVIIYFDKDCGMENVRAFSIIHQMVESICILNYWPEALIENENNSIETIKNEGFKLSITSHLSQDHLMNYFLQIPFANNVQLTEQSNHPIQPQKQNTNLDNKNNGDESKATSQTGGMISVNIDKTNRLMDLIGELIISEAMVTQNPDLKGLRLVNFTKAANQLNKITSELQDVVMSIRMVPLMSTFYKMQRIVRDMCKKMNKEVDLKIIGEETEVDKNIIDHISDPLMHLVRNAIDHGIESSKDRIHQGKPQNGTLTLEAKNSGSDVLIIIKDDGKGLSKKKILERAIEKGIVDRGATFSEDEILNLILLPGFSTKDSVTEFSGRGVGMDVVARNIESIGGQIIVESEEEISTTITLQIPLSLAIIDGMNVSVGAARYTLPTIEIRESFRPNENDIIKDPKGNEMIMVRGECYRIVRLHELFNIKTNITRFSDGIFIMIEHNNDNFCVFVDALIGQQQVVIKTLPSYIKTTKATEGLVGCTLLGDGSISLILNTFGISNMWDKQCS